MKRTPARRSDSVTAYYGYQNNVNGACGWLSTDTDYICGLSSSEVSSSFQDNCGKQVKVTLASDASKTVTCTVTDECANCDLYLSTAAFTALGGSLDAGMLDVTWEYTDGAAAPTTSAASSDEAADDGAKLVGDATSDAAAVTSSPLPAVTSEVYSSVVAASTYSEAATSTYSASTPANTGSTSTDGWKLSTALSGEGLFDFFNFDTGASDNSGAAMYVGRDAGLTYANGDGHAVIAIDSTQYAALRNSIRMTSSETFNVGSLVIVDVQEMPATCGVWPAIWMNGDGVWPFSGEIDIVEGVNTYTQNVVSVHTGSGCSLSSNIVSSLSKAVLKSPHTLDCDATIDTAACGFNMNSKTTYGQPFNAAGGGTYAVSITDAGISFYFWQQGSVPADVYSKTPTPSGWGDADVTIGANDCNIGNNFKNLRLVINTNLGGSFAGGVWAATGNGQDQTCADQTGFSNAYDYVSQVGSAFADAKWVIRSLDVYSQ
ncbi:glycoside hydrolase family 16 protein [Cylindrobasidium torrendii FP15055 ss-10]|uniref:Glycoside hydrolase family 16 protein n=1 Tax=Cylindrobasidium torrendii FP15055 ss-10 TaxID=1314674 RepID=A0A0D7BLI0_9AGAR|nr:glycoside hydrolase family 16 protein [Cylindrobasidium torrendii FP15055 ss-10]